jgi:uncharacterized protein YbjT (DUF2867 family)
MKKAILFGASGFVGSYLLRELLDNPVYDQVTVVLRKAFPVASAPVHMKLKVLIGDLDSLAAIRADLVADDVFITLGTTQKRTPRRNEYYRIDHDYPILAAKFCKDNGATSVFIVTAVGANANSNFFYIKSKGATERDIRALDFLHTHIFRPSMIIGDRPEARALEKPLVKFWTILNPILIGPLQPYKGI